MSNGELQQESIAEVVDLWEWAARKRHPAGKDYEKNTAQTQDTAQT